MSGQRLTLLPVSAVRSECQPVSAGEGGWESGPGTVIHRLETVAGEVIHEGQGGQMKSYVAE